MTPFNFHRFTLFSIPVKNGFRIRITDGSEEKFLPLLPDEGQVERTLEALENTSIDPNMPFEFFCMMVAGCFSVHMKVPINNG